MAKDVVSASEPEALPPTEVELKYRSRAYAVHRVTKVASVFFICATVVIVLGTIGWTIVETSRALAGRNTSIKSDLNAQVEIEANVGGKGEIDAELSVPQLQPIAELLGSRYVVWILMGVCIVVAVVFARKIDRRRRDTIEQFAPFRKKYELESDPKRSSSGLTDRGDAQED